MWGTIPDGAAIGQPKGECLRFNELGESLVLEGCGASRVLITFRFS